MIAFYDAAKSNAELHWYEQEYSHFLCGVNNSRDERFRTAYLPGWQTVAVAVTDRWADIETFGS